MATNPLYTDHDPTAPQFTSGAVQGASGDLAADVIRTKVLRLYDTEPDAATEEAEAVAVLTRSKHQQYMYDLSASGKDLAAVQTEWHNYYLSLNETEKHQVWQEFYASQSSVTQPQTRAHEQQAVAKHKHAVTSKRPRPKRMPRPRLKDLRSPQAIQATIRDTVSAGGTLKVKHHLQSLLFGLGMGTLLVGIFLFGFFNEVIITPFIQPSRVAASTPLIVTAGSIAPTKNPEVIIPKINVEIPASYTGQSIDEAAIENDLESGIVHYPTTVMPGENGNAVYFGHSSNNIFSPGKYKFAFVLLHTLIPGDTFYLTYNSKVYVYKVITRDVVDPSNVGVLGPVPGQAATATLITCDPPGTSLKRLIVVGQQISPAPTTNTAPAVTPTVATTTSVTLPGNGPTLFSKFIKTVVGKISLIVVVLIILFFVFKWVRRPLSNRR